MNNLVTALSLALQIMAPSVEPWRADEIAHDMVTIVQEESQNGLHFDELTAATILGAAAVNETKLHKDAETCKTAGDGGRSIGLGQVMRGQNWQGHTKKEICSNRKLQLKLALHVMNKCWARTPRPDAAFRCYTAGNAAIDSDAAKRGNRTYLTINKIVKEEIMMRQEVVDIEKLKSTTKS